MSCREGRHYLLLNSQHSIHQVGILQFANCSTVQTLLKEVPNKLAEALTWPQAR